MLLLQMKLMKNTQKRVHSCSGHLMVLGLGVFRWEAAPGWAGKLLGGQQKGCVGNEG